MEFSRQQYQKLKDELGQARITILLGARQVGKSYLMDKLRKKVTGEAFFDLENPETLKDFHGDDEHVYNLLKESGKYIFIDEFQYIENISHIFKAIYDHGQRQPKEQIKIFASGSSSLEIHKHLKESLAGRKEEIIIRPLSIAEYRSELPSKLDDYFVYGGLPGVYQHEKRHERQNYLEEILKTYIQKDIKALVKEEHLSAFNKMVYYLAENQGQVIAINNIANDLRIKYHDVEKYLDLLEQTFVLYPLASYSKNLSNELKKSRKFYFYDLGIRNLLVKDFSSISRRKDRGLIWETYCYHQLLSIKQPNTGIYFWRTSHGNEVDFIWELDKETVPIEVKNRIEANEIPDGIKRYLEAYPKSKFAIVFYASSKSIKDKYYESDYKGHQIFYVNIYESDYLEELLLWGG